MIIAVEGCAHGELDKIYETLEHVQKSNNVIVDLLLICGDFQAVRNTDDLQCMAVPPKYQKLNTFYKYYSGEKIAPILTVFIGGNHEASNYLSELSYGGWVCPNIYYMGYANIINIGSLRIGGLSGIYKGQNYLKGHFEIPPYKESEKRSVYHVRNIDVFRLKQVKQPIDIFLSHDWPRGIYNFGNKEQLLRFKPFFKDDIDNNKLGSRPAEELLNKLQPTYWFAAHMHCKFAAVVQHDNNGEKSTTKFLALDKCLPRRRFLHLVDVPKGSSGPLTVQYDAEWLSILRSTNHLLNTTKCTSYMPGPGCSERYDFSVTEEELKAVRQLYDNNLVVPENFQHTAEPHHSSSPCKMSTFASNLFINPQTTAFCKKLEITDPHAVLAEGSMGKIPKEFSFIEDLNVTISSQKSIDPDGSSASEDEAAGDEATSTLDVVSNSFNLKDMENLPFFIDTKGTPPERKKASLAQSTPSSTSKVSEYKEVLCDFPEFKEKNEDQAAAEAGNATSENNGSPPKKFKRRNQAIYMNDDDS